MTESETKSTQSLPRPFEAPSKKMVAGMLAAMTLFLVVPGVFILCLAFSDGGTILDRSAFLLLAAVLLFLPARILAVGIRRKVTTGQWTITGEERLQMRQRWSSPGSLQRMKRLKWIDYLMSVLWAIFAGTWIVMSFRKPDAGLFNWLMAIIWVGLAAFSCWQHWVRYRKSAAQAA